MKNTHAIIASVVLIGSSCQQINTPKQIEPRAEDISLKTNYNGYESQEKWGEHLVTITGCNDCHTPKIMTPQGPALDSTLWLSGHPAQMPPPDVDRKEMEKNGIVLTNMLTAWVGPWGISYAQNLTSDPTGIGNWKEEQFIYALREGKFQGMAGLRDLLPPMPWQMFKHMTDDELKAVFAYLKSTKPIENIVPPPVPPALAQQ